MTSGSKEQGSGVKGGRNTGSPKAIDDGLYDYDRNSRLS